MTAVSWSRVGGEDCVRIGGGAAGRDVRVSPALTGAPAQHPPMAGRLVPDGDDVCFVPRFGFTEGTVYRVVVDGEETGVLARPRRPRPATTEVVDIRPSSTVVPRNLLRLYVSFSAPMSEGDAADHVRLVDEAGDELTGALLPLEQELWDGSRLRLTVLLDPARIKRGLVAHREVGYPLRPGAPIRVVVDDGFRDATGATLVRPAERRYEVSAQEHRRVDPGAWVVTAPAHATRQALAVALGRPLDHGLLTRCLRVVGPDERLVDGTVEVGAEERSWRFWPRAAWAPGSHRLLVDPVLEDVAGNSVRRVFDRDLTRPEDDPGDGPVSVAFMTAGG